MPFGAGLSEYKLSYKFEENATFYDSSDWGIKSPISWQLKQKVEYRWAMIMKKVLISNILNLL